MTEEAKQKLLKDRKVIDEINRHLWIESEKAGYDIGFEQATADWMEKFSKAWISYHTGKRKSSTVKKRSVSKSTSSKRSPKASTLKKSK